MSIESSPGQDLQMLLRRRGIFIIPKDQQRILSQEGSWAADESQRQGTPLVPSNILENITKTFLVQMKHEAGNREDISGPVPSRHADRHVELAEPTVVTEQQDDTKAQQRHNEDDGEAEEQPSSPADVISDWSVSPPRSPPKRDPAPPIPVPAVPETPIVNLRAEDVNTGEENDEDEDEMDMDMELPQAHENSSTRVNLESTRAQATPQTATRILSQVMETLTPPCAQPEQHIIPATVGMENKTNVEQNRRRFRVIDFGDTASIRPVNPSTSLTRLPATSRMAEVESSLLTSSSSLIPATCATASTQHSTAVPPATAVPPPPPPPPPPPSPPKAPISSAPNSQGPQSPSETHIDQAVQAPSTNQPPSPPAPSSPYTLFTVTYPSYAFHSGSLKNFIKACLCLEYLESERALHEFLYDDFIRAFASGYLKYVLNAQQGQEPLPAIEWFNMLQGKPEYDKMVITRQNLRSILDMFPEEVARARRYISAEPSRHGRAETRETSVAARSINIQTPDMSPPGRANLPRKRKRPSQPSPELGSDAPVFPNPVPTSSARPKAPSASQYFERLASMSRSGAGRKRSDEERDRLREHFRRRKASSALSVASRHGSS